MPKVPVTTSQFSQGNSWGIRDRDSFQEFSLPFLLHAAVTVGHDHGWRQTVGVQTGGLAELLWKQSSFLTTVQQQAVTNRRQSENRLVPTQRFQAMDPSERRALTYHLGMTMSTAWARKVLKVPWLLHLDVYRDRLAPNLQMGNSRPDLVGRHPDGRWVVMECKGRASAPSQDAMDKAKGQAKRVIDIGGVTPSLHLAMFSYFGADRSVAGRRKPRVVTVRAIDPPLNDKESDPIRLRALTDNSFFQLYYEQWDFLFEDHPDVLLADDGLFVWRELKDLDLRVGILKSLRRAVRASDYKDIPALLQEVGEEPRGDSSEWSGDGLILDFGESWHRNFDYTGDPTRL